MFDNDFFQILSSLDSSAKLIFYIMISFGFFIGLILMVDPQIYESFNRALNKEFGFRFRFFRKIEDSKNENIDRFASKHSGIIGLILCVVTFILLIIYK